MELEARDYELIGRIIVETAVLDGRLIELAIRLAWQSRTNATFESLQVEFRGLSGRELRQRLDALVRATGEGPDRESFASLAERVAERQEVRNALAHNMQFGLPDGRIVGFRTTPKPSRSSTSEVTTLTIQDRAGLEENLRLVREVSQEALDWVNRFPRPPSRMHTSGN